MQIQLHLNLHFFFYRLCLPIAIMGFSVALIMAVSLLFNRPPVQAQQGVLDLSDWNIQQKSQASLNGEWAFVWNELIPPSEATLSTIKNTRHFLSLPGTWNGKQYDGYPLPGQGKATLLLALIPPEGSQDFAIKVPMLTNQFQLWVDGEIKVKDPSFGSAFALSSANERTRYISFSKNQTDSSTPVILMFHLINNRHRDGGMWESLYIAPKHLQQVLHQTPVLLDISIAFLLCCVSVLMVIKSARTHQISLLYLAIFAALMALRGGTVNERLLFSFFEIHEWETQQTLEYLFLYASIPFFALYLGHRFPRYFPPIMHWITSAICGALILLVAITPASVYSYSAPIFQFVVLVYVFLWLGTMTENIYQKEKGAILLFIGGLAFIVAGINDILFTNNLISSTNAGHLGALIFTFFAHFSQRQMHGGIVAEKEQTTLQQAVFASAKRTQPKVEKNKNSKHPLSTIFNPDKEQTQQQLNKTASVEALKYALRVWEQVTGKDKLALADESKLWRVTNDGGTLKTRTLDKYLRVDLLPQNPRYNTVAKTLRFIAMQDEINEDDRYWLNKTADILTS